MLIVIVLASLLRSAAYRMSGTSTGESDPAARIMMKKTSRTMLMSISGIMSTSSSPSARRPPPARGFVLVLPVAGQLQELRVAAVVHHQGDELLRRRLHLRLEPGDPLLEQHVAEHQRDGGEQPQGGGEQGQPDLAGVPADL